MNPLRADERVNKWTAHMLYPHCCKCKRIATFRRGSPSLTANNNKWSGAWREMVMMLWIDAAIHHNRIYVCSHPLYRSSSCRERSKGTHVFWYLFPFGDGFSRLSPEPSVGIALSLICCYIFSTSPPLLLLYVLMLRLLAPHAKQEHEVSSGWKKNWTFLIWIKSGNF